MNKAYWKALKHTLRNLVHEAKLYSPQVPILVWTPGVGRNPLLVSQSSKGLGHIARLPSDSPHSVPT